MRLIDNPDAQKTVTCIVDRSVLVRILDIASLNDSCSAAEALQLHQWAAEVRSGERVSLTADDWTRLGFGGTAGAEE